MNIINKLYIGLIDPDMIKEFCQSQEHYEKF